MISVKRNIIMAGVLLFSVSTLTPLYSIDDKPVRGGKSCSDFIVISGESNINQFSFYYNRTVSPLVDNSPAGSDPDKIIINIPVKDFTAGNPLMYDDFLTLLKAAEHPVINISFQSDITTIPGLKSGSYSSPIYITIAGISREYPLSYSVTRCSQGFFLSGSQSVRLSDFKLRRPERLVGLVKVRDEISVSFGFIVNFTDSNQISSQR